MLIAKANIANTYDHQGRYRGESVVATLKRVLGEEHLVTIASLSKLSSTYGHEQRYKRAVVLQVQVMDANAKQLGASYPNTLASMRNLALSY